VLAVGAEVHVARGALWRGLARIDERRLPTAALDQIERAAADTGTDRLHHRQRRAHRHRGVAGIAAGRQHLEAGFGGQRMRAGNGAQARRGGRRQGKQQADENDDQIARDDGGHGAGLLTCR
jgi:hypothetical protein